jgi:hypothetical protein
MKEAKNRGKRVKLVRDRLFINNEEYVPEEEQITLPAATACSPVVVILAGSETVHIIKLNVVINIELIS